MFNKNLKSWSKKLKLLKLGKQSVDFYLFRPVDYKFNSIYSIVLEGYVQIEKKNPT